MYKTRTVVTGVGIVSPIGIGKEQFWDNLFEGVSGFSDITLFDTKDLKVKVGAEVKNFKPEEILGDKRLMDLDRATLLLLSATKLALDDSGLKIDSSNTLRTGVSVGSTFGSLHSISRFDRQSLTEGPRYANPSVFPSTVGNSPASRVSIKFGIKGFNTTISTGMCASLDAIDYSRDFLELGRADTILTGSVEDFAIQTFLGFYHLGYLAGLKGELESCPFDKRRNGIIFSEGSTMLVLQEEAAAKKSNTKIYARIVGTGSCFDPSKFYRYNPKGEGMIRAMTLALEDAGCEAKDIDCIFANANSTKDADLIETNAIKEVFGASAHKIPVVAVKSGLGEAYSSSGGFAAVAAIGSLNKGLIPPTINYSEADFHCDLDYVSNEAREAELSRVMINTFGPNGTNTSIVIAKGD